MEENRVRVLHVDADRRWVERCAAHLQENHGFEMVTACDAETGMEYLEHSAIDCVLSGLRLPGVDGLDFLDHVRRAHPQMPFILLTAETSEDTVQTAVEAGVSDYIPKFTVNISEDLLAHRIRQAVASERPTELTGSGSREVEPSPDRLLHVVESALGGDPGTDSGVGWTDGGSKTLEPTNSGGLFSVVRSAIDSNEADDTEESGDELVWVPIGESDQTTDAESGRSGGSTVDSGREAFNWTQFANGASGNGATTQKRSDRSAFSEASGSGHTDRGDESGGHATERTASVREERPDPESGGSSGIESLVRSLLETGDGTDESRNGNGTGASDATSPGPDDRRGDVPGGGVTEPDPGTRSGETETNPEVSTLSGDIFPDSTEERTGTDIVPVEDGEPDDVDTEDDGDGLLDDERPGDEHLSDELLDDELLDGERPGDELLDDQLPGDGSERSLSDHPELDALDEETLDTLDREELLHLLRTLLDEDGDGGETVDETETWSADDSGVEDDPVGNGQATAVSGTGESEGPLGERDLSETATETESKRAVTDPEVGETATGPDSLETVTGLESDEDGADTGRDDPSTEAGSTESVTETESEDVVTDSEVDDAVTGPGSDGGDTGTEFEDRGADQFEEMGESSDPDQEPEAHDEFVESEDFGLPADLDLEAGSAVLVQCGSQDERKSSACTDLLGTDQVADRQVLLVRYRKMSESRLERIATDADRTKIISIGYAQPIPQSVEDTVENVKINNPNDVTRLGIVVSGTIDEWQSTDGEVVLCFDPLDVLIQYKNVQSAFRFLHIFLSKLESGNVISHFHVDPSAGDPQEINTLKPLFDSVVTIDSVGTHLETQ